MAGCCRHESGAIAGRFFCVSSLQGYYYCCLLYYAHHTATTVLQIYTNVCQSVHSFSKYHFQRAVNMVLHSAIRTRPSGDVEVFFSCFFLLEAFFFLVVSCSMLLLALYFRSYTCTVIMRRGNTRDGKGQVRTAATVDVHKNGRYPSKAYVLILNLSCSTKCFLLLSWWVCKCTWLLRVG